MVVNLARQTFLWASHQSYQDFRLGLKGPAFRQQNLLCKLASVYQQSPLSEVYGPLSSVNDFSRLLPMVTYEDLRERIEYGRNYRVATLTSEVYQHYEPTSGSSGGPKWIPYGQELFTAFQSMFTLWSHDLLRQPGLKLKSGKFYFSISPLMGESTGLSDDRDYLKGPMKWLLGRFWVGHELKALRTPEHYLEALLITLLKEPDLEVLSFWSPRLLLAVLDYWEANRKAIQTLINSGQYERGGVSYQLKRRELGTSYQELFPGLKLVSCWGDAGAAQDYQLLTQKLEHAHFQKKGLLATEGPLTIPLWELADGGVPLVDHLYYEFLDEEGQCYRLDQVELGAEYEILFSHLGGLFRYRLGDRVKVIGWLEQTPILQFVGRQGLVSDLCGEKLSDAEVREALGAGWSLFPQRDHYIAIGPGPKEREEVDQRLRALSVHYDFARSAGQLQSPEVFFLEDPWALIEQFLTQKRGMKLGDIKPQTLFPRERDHELLRYLLAQVDE